MNVNTYSIMRLNLGVWESQLSYDIQQLLRGSGLLSDFADSSAVDSINIYTAMNILIASNYG